MKLFQFIFCILALSGVLNEASYADDLANRRAALIEGVFDRYRLIYEDFHQNPELSGKEIETSAKYAAELRNIGFDVTHGLVAMVLLAC
jgi:hypothetical protein